MKRRTFVRLGGAFATGAVATVAGIEAGSESASAQAATTLDVAGDRVLLDDGGAIAAVRLALNVEWAYDLPEGVQPAAAVTEIAAGTDGTQLVATSESAQLFRDADGSESFDVDLVAEGVLDPDALTPDVGERATEVTVEAAFYVENSDGVVLAEASAADSATVTVEAGGIDPTEYGSVGGSGSLTIDVE